MKRKKRPQSQALPRIEQPKVRLRLFKSWEQTLGLLFFLTVVGLTIWVANSIVRWMENPERVVLSQLVVTGERIFTTDEDVQKSILALGLPDTFIGQDVDVIQQEVMRLPWIQQVSVRKQWPDKLIVNVVEYQPYVRWNEVFLLDQQGTIFSMPDDRPVTKLLPQLLGPEGKEKTVLQMYEQLHTLLQNSENGLAKRVKIDLLSANERFSWKMLISTCPAGTTSCAEKQSIEVILGRKDIEPRFKRFMLLFGKIVSQTPADQQIIRIDLRYNNGLAVKRDKIKE